MKMNYNVHVKCSFLFKVQLLGSSIPVGSITAWACLCVCVCLCDSYDYGSLAVICLCIDEEPDSQRMWLVVANWMNDSYGLGTMLMLSSAQLSNIERQHPEMVRRCI